MPAADGEMVKHICLRHPIEIIRRRDVMHRYPATPNCLTNAHQACRVRVGQRTEQHSIDDGEDGGSTGNPKGQGKKRGQSEARILAQHAQAEPKILTQRTKHGVVTIYGDGAVPAD